MALKLEYLSLTEATPVPVTAPPAVAEEEVTKG